ncbi:DUF1697 domain-containing protein [Rugosimonospora africana]|uniref:DUF1697 domain-containing protein n=1 Tax=Rugosimonospora africana TaxID=556532 RepID=A0A8J3QT99_9ACTN|nr:DUF1697 domain-containing protein [Rugosimonospora africana]GIH16413.1 hypothetical protein Raf01_45850 [Rugosimonospora africana]
MVKYAVLLRGVNLGSNRRIAMQDLRALLAGLGYQEVRTLLQSGNAVFAAPRRKPEALCTEISERMGTEFGMKIGCVIRTADELAAVVDANPFPDKASQGSKLAVTFLAGPVDPARFADADPADFAPDEFRLGEREIYTWLPNGFSNSKIPVNFWDKRADHLATTRNWNTVTKLLAMARD